MPEDTPNPLNVEVGLDIPRAASSLITTSGGSLAVLGADGASYTLTFPEGALIHDEQITITPVAGIEGMHFSGAVVGGIQMAPEGLRLLKPAILTIESPKVAALKGYGTVGCGYQNHGDDLYLNHCEITGNLLSMEVVHFSGRVAVQATPAEVQTHHNVYIPSNEENAFTQRVQEYIGKERQRQLLGLPTDPDMEATIINFLHEAFDKFLGPKLPVARENCSESPAILSRAIGFIRQVQLFGLDETFRTETDLIEATWVRSLAHCLRSRVLGTYWGLYMLTGTICSLDSPFTVSAAGNLGNVPADGAFQFSPAGDGAGTWSYNGTMHFAEGDGAYSGSGSYQLDVNPFGPPGIIVQPGSNWKVTFDGITVPLNGGYGLGTENETIYLLRIDYQGCN